MVRKVGKMHRITEEAMRETFRETVSEVETSPILKDLFDTSIQKFKSCTELATLPLKEKLYYALLMGYSMKRCLERQFIMDITQEKLHENLDGYEVKDEHDTVHIILTEKNHYKSEEDAKEFISKDVFSKKQMNKILQLKRSTGEYFQNNIRYK